MEETQKELFKQFVYDCYHFGKKLAKKTLFSNIKRIGYQRAYEKILSPVTDWTRFTEFFITNEFLKNNLKNGAKILDIGSPKLFSIWFAKNNNVTILSTDIWKYAAFEYYNFWQYIKNTTKSTVTFETADLLNLKYNQEFDQIFSISTIEHAFDYNWQNLISLNLTKALKKNGRIIITCPFGSKNLIQYKNNLGYSNVHLKGKYKNFFQRIIDKNEVDNFSKIAKKYNLILEKIYTINTKSNIPGLLIRRLPPHLMVLLGFLKPRLAIQNFYLKSALQVAENEKYEEKYKSDAFYSDIVMIFRKS